jgi:hypothetical protein
MNHFGLMVVCVMALFFASMCNKTTVPLETSIPDITVLAPCKDSIYYIGDSMAIKWKLKESLSVSGLVIELSVDNGKSYWPFESLLATNPWIQGGPIFWEIPDSVFDIPRSVISDSCRMFIHDYFDYTISGLSNRFSIHKR